MREDITRVLFTREQITERVSELGAQQVEVPCRYTGFECPNEFIVGYGLDYAERYRNLPYVGVLDPAVYAEPGDSTSKDTREGA